MYNSKIKELIELVADIASETRLERLEGVELLKDIIKDIDDDTVQFINSFKNMLSDYCVEYEICNDCVKYGEITRHDELRDYGDTHCVEEIRELVCPECGKEV
jgi:hypothetical protein